MSGASNPTPTPKTKPIKTDLFRFATLRTPQLIDEQRKDLGFIFHPNPSQSVFLEEAAGSEIDQARTFVREALGDFTDPIKTYLKVKELNKDLYKFSTWLMNNRNTLTKDEVIPEIGSLTVLTDSVLYKLWDNLYYQVLTRKSSYVRQACIQMIMANNFIAKYNTYVAAEHKGTEEEFLIRLANAKVVIDKAFTIEESGVASKVPSLDQTNKYLEKIENKYVAEQDNVVYSKAIEELSELDGVYQKAYQDAYNNTKEAHLIKIKPLIDKAKLENDKAQLEEDRLAFEQKREPRILDLELDLPEFNFQFESPYTAKYLDRLTTATKNCITHLQLDQKKTLNEAVEVLQKKMKENAKHVFAASSKSKKSIVINGSELKPKQDGIPQEFNPGCFNIRTISKRFNFSNGVPQTQILMNINLGAPGLSILSQSHQVVFGSNTFTSTSSHIQSQSGSMTVLRLFDDPEIFVNSLSYDLSGVITLNNNTKITYAITVSGGIGYACGTIEKVSDSGATTPINVELYGVGKIGVADFRKVEQEICCYVPGEVSHIENILAREYKERSTRSLTSVEQTTEVTSEKEVENLTDTSTTERNEMQSEVATTLTEDASQAYGASAGVSGGGKRFNFHADAYADFSNSSSSSLSNTNAQTYAQEITERTLERIVQKTTKKRTSRVLKEFEENNKHGFDNRQGEQHVSGVYRWIDIIYKNQLVNYGKRLMYEFMLPEPSRFFKEAIIKKEIDDTSNSSNIFVLDEPKPLEDFGVFTASDITESNYQELAAAYNVEVTLPPMLYVWKGKAFNHPAGGGEYYIDVPQGYRIYKANVKAIHRGGGSQGTAGWAVGDDGNFTTSIVGDDHFSYVYDEKLYEEKVPVNAFFREADAGLVNIDVQFKRTNRAVEQWQNEMFKALSDAYNNLLEAYRESRIAAYQNGEADTNQEAAETVRFNPLFNRAIEKRELKRICIEMLTQPFRNPMGQDNYKVKDACDINFVNQNAEFENHAAHVKFFEQAFDWEIMAYLFYPYYWAKSCDWSSLIQQTDAADPIFQAFLQSGMARAVVPVRPGFEDAVAYYIETGDIWNGGDLVIDHEDDLYVSIAEEMQVIEGAVEDEWETRMPTALTMIQKDTIGLNEEGLPCCDFVLHNEDGDDYTNPIKKSEALIGGPVATNTSSDSDGATKEVVKV